MRETGHFIFVRICIIGRREGGRGFYTQGRERLRFLDQYIRLRSRLPNVRGSLNLEAKLALLIFLFFFSIFSFLLIFYAITERTDNGARFQRPIFTRDSRFPRLITRTKWTRISWLSCIDFLSVETMSGRSYSEIIWRPTREFRRNARINQQGSYSLCLVETRCVICKRLDDRAKEEITMRIKMRTCVFASNNDCV